jgi:hypothetical protein
MADHDFPKAAMRKVEKRGAFPLAALAGITELYLNAVETETIIRARALEANAEDIADALGITRQGVYYKLKALCGEKGATANPSESQAEVSTPASASVIVLPDLEGAHIPDRSGL